MRIEKDLIRKIAMGTLFSALKNSCDPQNEELPAVEAKKNRTETEYFLNLARERGVTNILTAIDKLLHISLMGTELNRKT